MSPAAPPLPRVGIASAGVVLLGLAATVGRTRDGPAATTFAVLLVVLALSALASAAAAATPALNKFAWLLAYLLIPAALAVFSADYYGLATVASRGRLGAFLAPIAIAILGGVVTVLGTATYAAGASPPLSVLGGFPDLVYWLGGIARRIGIYYAGGVMLVAVGLVLSTVARYEHLDAALGVTLAAIGVWPWLVYLLMPAIVPPVSLGTILWAFVSCFWGSVAVAALALWHFDLFAGAPAAGTLGPDAALDAMDEAVVVVDHHERVLRVNEAARAAFGVTPEAVVGGPLSAVLGADLDRVRSAGTFELKTAEGTREFESTVSAMTDSRGARRGFALVLRDVTERRTREQRLAVLNRVLRHNLRNDMTRIIGRAELVSRRAGNEDSEGEGEGDNTASASVEGLADSILDTADDLVSLGERAREVEEMMALPRRLDATATLVPVVEAVVADVGATHPEASFETDVPAEATVAGQAAVLEVVLGNLVENACEHTDVDEPTVRIDVARPDPDSDTLTITVADDGPGIPAEERAVLEAGEEDPLQHGSGLGLWAVQWGVRRLGGNLDFAENEPRGAVVTVTLPTPPEERNSPSEQGGAGVEESAPAAGQE